MGLNFCRESPKVCFLSSTLFLEEKLWKDIQDNSRRTYKQSLHAVKAFYCSLETLYMTGIHSHILAFIYHTNHTYFDLNILIPPKEAQSNFDTHTQILHCYIDASNFPGAEPKGTEKNQ